MDPDNPVVQLCTAGMAAENAGRLDEARAYFEQAWSIGRDALDACIAAHFLARYQADPALALAWNQCALDHADQADEAAVREFYPSLYLNLGWSYEQLSDLVQARRYYDLGIACLAVLPDTPYSAVVQRGLTMAQQRMKASETATTPPVA